MKEIDAECKHTGCSDKEKTCLCRSENTRPGEPCQGECSADGCRCRQEDS